MLDNNLQASDAEVVNQLTNVALSTSYTKMRNMAFVDLTIALHLLEVVD